MTILSATQEELALNGGSKSLSKMEGKPQPKVGIEEFLSIAERFGFSEAAMEKLRATVSDSDLPPGGQHLGRYYSVSSTKGEAYAAQACKLFGTKFAVGVSSGTGSLHAAMVAVGVKNGKEVIVPAIGFVATSGSVVLAGGTPVFCDVDESMQIDPSKIEALITPNTVAIAPTHWMGNICDMDPILAIAKKHRLKVIEDCAQAPGGKYKGRFVGSMGDIGCFSISCYKIIGGGEGGLLITNDEKLFDTANQVIEGGGLWRQKRFAPPRYEGELFVGTNYRLSELEAAVNVIQLKKLSGIVSRYHGNKMRILSLIKTTKEVPLQKLNDVDGEVGYALRFYPQTHELGATLATALRAEGVNCIHRGPNPGDDWHLYSEMHPLGKSGSIAWKRGTCPVADDLFGRNLHIVIDQWWTQNDCEKVAHAINKVFGAFCTES